MTAREPWFDARGDWQAPAGSPGRLRWLANLILAGPRAITEEGADELARGVLTLLDSAAASHSHPVPRP